MKKVYSLFFVIFVALMASFVRTSAAPVDTSHVMRAARNFFQSVSSDETRGLSSEIAYKAIFAPNLLFGEYETTDTIGPYYHFCSGYPTVTDTDGHSYPTIQIGNQCWMRKNLRTRHFNNGTALHKCALGVSNPSVPSYYLPYGEDEQINDTLLFIERYGLLYNRLALIESAQNNYGDTSTVHDICPEGWHLPNYEDFETLVATVMSMNLFQCGGQQDNISKALASTEGWIAGTNECSPGGASSTNNATGFSMMPTGIVYEGDLYTNQAYLWFMENNSASVTYEEVTVSDTTILFAEDFEGNFSWYSWDRDQDGYNWEYTTTSRAHSGTHCEASASFQNNYGPLTPDNYLITPAVTLTGNPVLSFWVTAEDPNWADEHFSVYVITELTTTALQYANPLYSGTATGDFVEHTVDLSDYAGLTCHIAFRHHNTTDMFRLNLDDVVIMDIQNTTMQVGTAAPNVYGVFGFGSDETNPDAFESADVDFALPVRCVKDEMMDILPYLTTSEVTGATTTSAQASGWIIREGITPLTERGFCWSRTHYPTIADEHVVVPLEYLGWYTANMGGLLPNTTYWVRAYATNDHGTAYGNVVQFTTLALYPTCSETPTVTDYDGNSYETVRIGDQCWMRQNLRTSHYADGGSIPFATASTFSNTLPYYYYPNGNADLTERYGYLYNHEAVMHGEESSSLVPSCVQGVCPDGWHLPSQGEFDLLLATLAANPANQCGDSSSHVAASIASAEGWQLYVINGNTYDVPCSPGDTGTHNNASSFDLPPAGIFAVNFFGNGQFGDFGLTAAMWSASYDYDRNSYLLAAVRTFWQTLGTNNYSSSGSAAYSVRCLKNEYTAYLPVVVTDEVTNIAQHTADGGGQVLSSGGLPLLRRGVCWSTSPNPTVEDYLVENGADTGMFVCTMTDLEPSTTYYVRAFVENPAALVYGQEVIFTTLDEMAMNSCPGHPFVTDFDGNIYNTIQIGDQCWMKENLRVTHYADGTLIPLGDDDSETEGLRYYPNENPANVTSYGYLYNWLAVMKTSPSSSENPSGVQGVCPNGWHLPSDAEWTQLDNTLVGDQQLECYANTECFAMLQAGRYYWGETHNFLSFAGFWSATRSNEDDAAYMRYSYYSDVLERTDTYISRAYSVRCVLGAAYALHYDANGGNGSMDDQNFQDGIAYAVRPSGFLRPSCPFVSWNTAADGSGVTYEPGDSIVLTENMTLYAVWDTSGVVPGQTCGTYTVADHEGNIYNTVQVGDQCWLRENLRTTTSPTTHALLVNNTDDEYTYTGKMAKWYGNDTMYASMNYGLLYNWNAAMDTFNLRYSDEECSIEENYAYALGGNFQEPRRGICPQGWHLPNMLEWMHLKEYLESTYACACEDSHERVARTLASTTGWEEENGHCHVGSDLQSNNLTEFTALPAGMFEDRFRFESTFTAFWTSTRGDRHEEAMRFELYSDNDYFNYRSADKSEGVSVRCICDTMNGLDHQGLPVVTTAAVSDVGAHSAVCGGNIISDGGSTITKRGVCWSTSPNPTVDDPHSLDGTSHGEFVSLAYNLNPETIYYIRAYAINSDGVSYGQTRIFITGVESTFVCGQSTVADHEGNVYHTVQVGRQCWTKENMRCTTSPTTGTPLLQIPALGISDDVPHAYAYNDDLATADNGYGFLYNWSAAMDGTPSSSANPCGVRGVCPQGWHIPTGAEWNAMKQFLYPEYAIMCGYNYGIANVLCDTIGWGPAGDCGTLSYGESVRNAIGFSILPAGGYHGYFFSRGAYTYFWTATRQQSGEYEDWDVLDPNSDIYSRNQEPGYAVSVRCLRNELPRAEAIDFMIDTSICEGDVFVLNGQQWNTAGRYETTIANPNGLDTMVTVNLTVLPLPVVAIAGDNSISLGQTTMLTAMGAETYRWNTGHISDWITVAPTYTITYSVEGTDENGCKASATRKIYVDCRVPSVQTLIATDVGPYSATVSGAVTSSNGAEFYKAGICWAETPNPTLDDNEIILRHQIGSFQTTLTDLWENKTYYYRAYAVNSLGVAYGDVKTFTTLLAGTRCLGAPTVTDHEGNVYNTVHIGSQCWTKENMRCLTGPTTGQMYLHYPSLSGWVTEPQAFYYFDDPSTISRGIGLLYNWWAYMDGAEPSDMPVRGICPAGWHVPDVSELEQLVEYVSSVPQYLCENEYGSHIGKALADVRGWPKRYTLPCMVGYDQSSNNATGFTAMNPVDTYDGTVFACTTVDTVDATHISNYGNNAYGIYGMGLDLDAYREDAGVTSTGRIDAGGGLAVRCLRDEALPVITVTTKDAEQITAYDAISGGDISIEGPLTVTERGVCWSTNQNPTLADAHTIDGGGTGSFSSHITDLFPATTYYVRAYASDSVETIYGEQKVFKTSCSVNTIFSDDFDGDTLRMITSHRFDAQGDWSVMEDSGNPMHTPVYSQAGNASLTTPVLHVSSSNNTFNHIYLDFDHRCHVSPLDVATIRYQVAYSTTPEGEPLWEPWRLLLYANGNEYSGVYHGDGLSNMGVTIQNGSFSENSYYGWNHPESSPTSYYKTWHHEKFDLYPIVFNPANQVPGWFRFQFVVNKVSPPGSATDTCAGWYLDNVAVTLANCDDYPYLLTAPVKNVTSTTAVSGGRIPYRGEFFISRGVCWNTDSINGPDVLHDDYTSDDMGPGAFTSTVRGLTPNTTYYLQAYATTSAGTSYGGIRKFTTGCDSVNVIVLGDTSIINGDSIFLIASGAHTYLWGTGDTTAAIAVAPSATTTYTVTGTDQYGCTGSATVTVTVDSPVFEYIEATACGSYTWNGQTYTVSGDYTQTFTAVNGSDSVVTLHLTLLYSETAEYAETACDSYTWNGSVYTQSGDYVQTFTNAAGCVNVVTLHLTLTYSDTTDYADTACNSYTWNDSVYTYSGDYVQTFTNAEGCDSVVTLHLTLTYSDTTDYADTACNSYTWNDSVYTYSGDYVQTFTNAEGCDSVVTLHLTLKYSDTAEYAETACDSYTWNGQTYTESGDYIQTLTAANGCDSVVTLHLTLNHPETAEYEETACDSYTWNGQTYTESGDYIQTFTAANGCDSVVTLHLTVNPSYEIYVNDTAVCDHVYTYDSLVITPTECGTFQYDFTYFTQTGCDSVVHLTLLVTPNITMPTVVTGPVSDITYFSATCGGNVTADGGVSVTVRGVCWSTSPNPTVGDSHTVDGSGMGEFTSTLTGLAPTTTYYVCAYATNSAGTSYGDVVSFTTLEQTPCEEPTGLAVVEVTDESFSFTWDDNPDVTSWNIQYRPIYGLIIGFTSDTNSYTITGLTPGTTYQFQVQANCGPGNLSYWTPGITVTLPTDTIDVTVCDSYTWGGQTYTASGDYTRTFTAADGSDSILTLHLTVNQPVPELVEVNACDSYEWNGQTYTASGDYTQTFTAANGCDSVVTLHLTVQPPKTSTSSVTICENELPYLWNGQTCTQSGDYTQTFTAANGCDSAVTLHLTVVAAPTLTISADHWTMCAGGTTTLYASVNASSQLPNNFSYEWIVDGGTPVTGVTSTYNLTLNTAGNHTVQARVTQGTTFGCTSTLSNQFTVLVAEQPVVSLNITDGATICSGGTTTMNGVITNYNNTVNGVTNSDIYGSLSFNWTSNGNAMSYHVNVYNAQDQLSQTLLTPGNYTYQVSVDASGYNCQPQYSNTVTVTVAPSYTATISGNGNVCEGGSVTLNATVNNVLPNDALNYQWYRVTSGYPSLINGATSSTYETSNILLADSYDYYVVVTSSIPGCGLTSPSVPANVVSDPSVSLQGDNSVCVGNSLSLNAFISGGVPGSEYNYAWGFAGDCSGVYETNSPYFTYDANCYDGSLSNHHYYFAVTISRNDNTGCNATSTIHTVDLYNSSTTSISESACGSYTWNGQTYTASGDYTQTFTAANGCDSVVTLHLTLHPVPSVTISGSTTINCGQSDTLTANGASTYTWSTGESADVISVSPTSTTTYTVTGTSQYGCTATASATVTVISIFTITATSGPNGVITPSGSSTVYCGQSLVYTIMPNLNYVIEDVLVDGVSVGAPAFYIFTNVTDNHTIHVTFRLPVAPTVVTNAATAVAPTSAILNATFTNPDSIPFISEGFEWKATGSGSYSQVTGNINGNTFNANLTDLAVNTNYTFRAFVTFSGGTVYGAEMNFTTLCSTTSSAFFATTCDNIPYEWNGQTYSSSGTYTQTLTAANGCDSVVTLNLTLNPTYDVYVSDSAICGQEYSGYGIDIFPSDSGIYHYDIQRYTMVGCDSIIHLTLYVAFNDGIENFTMTSGYTFYPNPAGVLLNIQGERMRRVDVLDMTGRLISSSEADTPEFTRIDVTNLSVGHYLVKVTLDDGATVTGKIIVDRR